MSFTSNLKELRRGDSSLKLIYAISAISAAEDFSETIDTEESVIVGLGWKSTICKEIDVNIEFFFNLVNLDKNCIMKTNISSIDLKYSKTGIHTPNERTEWKSMGHMIPRMQRAALNKAGIAWITVVDLCITVYEVKILVDTISTKLYEDTELTDFFLSTAEGKVAVHKACLGVHSDVFKAMLQREWKETVEGQINLEGVTVQTLKDLKDYMYLGTVPDVGLRPLLLLASCYLIEDLKKHCIRKLAETVLPEDLFSLLEFACVNNIPELTYKMLLITPDSAVKDFDFDF